MTPAFFRGFHRNLIALAIASLPALAGSPVSGIKDFDRVDERVYRGTQPAAEGFAYLAKLGIKTILDLREGGARSTDEQRVVTALGMRYINVPMSGLTPPTGDQTNQVLALLEDILAGPVFVHCLRGHDRTGAVIAAYHIHHDRWDNARALEDAVAHGMSWLQFPRKQYILSFHPSSNSHPTAAVQ
jgi:tyrosine-protein phosphatase SIW14